MAKFERHIFICTNQRPPGHARGCCDPEGIAALQLRFKQELAARKLKGRVRANKAGCLDQCEHGPNVVVYPEGIWYGGVLPEDVAEIVESHIVSGVPVARLMLGDECINTESCEHRFQQKSESTAAPKLEPLLPLLAEK
jgi:(2Fe-2S) ferredoxin